MSNKMHDMRAVPAWDIKKIKGMRINQSLSQGTKLNWSHLAE